MNSKIILAAEVSLKKPLPLCIQMFLHTIMNIQARIIYFNNEQFQLQFQLSLSQILIPNYTHGVLIQILKPASGDLVENYTQQWKKLPVIGTKSHVYIP